MRRCTGALLCGGRSSRMGRDKALIEVAGMPLWRLQLEKLRAVCSEVVVCGSPAQRHAFESDHVRFESDAAPGLGPLSGIARAMETTRCSHVLVLAVDMPKMSEHYLSGLLEFASEGSGAVPENGGLFEGLCAVYPVTMQPMVLELLSGSDRSLQRLIKLGMERSLMQAKPVSTSERALFENWNAPADVAPVQK